MGSLEGIQEVDAVVGGFTVTLVPEPDRVVDLAKIPDALWREGVRTRRLTILADGTIEHADDGPRFRIAGWPAAYPIDGAAPPPGPARVTADVDLTGAEPRLRVRAGR
jgi:hypothetical protein